jgi:hypothetical protein
MKSTWLGRPASWNQKQEEEVRPCTYYPKDLSNHIPPLDNRNPMFLIMDKTLLPKPVREPESQTSRTFRPQPQRSVILCGTSSTKTSATVRQYLNFTHCKSENNPSQVANPFDFIFLINAKAPAQHYEDICSLLCLRKKHGREDDGISAEQLVKGWFAKPDLDPALPNTRDANWLLVFEGAEDPEEAWRSWPKDGRGAMIVTTENDAFLRHEKWKASVGFDLEQASCCGLVLR